MLGSSGRKVVLAGITTGVRNEPPQVMKVMAVRNGRTAYRQAVWCCAYRGRWKVFRRWHGGVVEGLKEAGAEGRSQAAGMR